jgi:hypothetical protein
MENYNGWANYATWRISLEFDFSSMFNSLRDVCDFAGSADAHDLSEALKNHTEDYLRETGSGPCLDYALSFVSDVDFYEIAEHILMDYKEEIEETEETV